MVYVAAESTTAESRSSNTMSSVRIEPPSKLVTCVKSVTMSHSMRAKLSMQLKLPFGDTVTSACGVGNTDTSNAPASCGPHPPASPKMVTVPSMASMPGFVAVHDGTSPNPAFGKPTFSLVLAQDHSTVSITGSDVPSPSTPGQSVWSPNWSEGICGKTSTCKLKGSPGQAASAGTSIEMTYVTVVTVVLVLTKTSLITLPVPGDTMP